MLERICVILEVRDLECMCEEVCVREWVCERERVTLCLE